MNNSTELFKLALGVSAPWKITEIEFKEANRTKELHVSIDFERGAKFPSATGELCNVYDTTQKTWRHLNFFEHSAYLHCRVPRIKTGAGNVELVQVPWARQNSGFTLLFEAYVMQLIENEMPINKVGKLVNENPHRIWTIFNHWIERAYSADMPKTPEKLGLDETSKRRGHNYVTVAANLDERRVIHVVEGKDKSAVKQIGEYLASKNIGAQEVKHASIDMSPSFISGIKEYFPEAEIHFDRFHVKKLLNEAMDEVRKLERKQHKELKGHKYLFLKNKENLTTAKQEKLSELITLYPVLGKAYRLKELFDDVWGMKSKDEASAFLSSWCNDVEQEGIEPFKRFVKTIKAHWSGIINFCETAINNGILEGINSKIQLAKRRARGYRQTENFINMIYFLCGKLKFDYPLRSS